jgi:hypothetical protein
MVATSAGRTTVVASIADRITLLLPLGSAISRLMVLPSRNRLRDERFEQSTPSLCFEHGVEPLEDR